MIQIGLYINHPGKNIEVVPNATTNSVHIFSSLDTLSRDEDLDSKTSLPCHHLEENGVDTTLEHNDFFGS